MQVIDFVPQDYIKRKRARKANLLCAILGAIVAVVMALSLMVTSAGSGEAEQLGEVMRQRLKEAAADIAKWQKIKSDRQALLERAEKSAELMNPLPHSRVLAEVVKALPPAAALTEFHMLDQKVKVIEASNAPVKRRGKQSAQVAREKIETRLRVIGLAPTDVEVARIIAGLSSSPILEKVELCYSEDQVVEGRMLRKFEVSLQLRDDAARLARAEPSKGGAL